MNQELSILQLRAQAEIFAKAKMPEWLEDIQKELKMDDDGTSSIPASEFKKKLEMELCKYISTGYFIGYRDGRENAKIERSRIIAPS